MKSDILKIIKDREAIHNWIYRFIKDKITGVVGNVDINFSIEDLEIVEFPKLEIQYLIDQRKIEVDNRCF